MNNKTTTKVGLDLELTMFDFTEGLQEDLGRASIALQTILLDERTCRARIEYLETLQNIRNEAVANTDTTLSSATDTAIATADETPIVCSDVQSETESAPVAGDFSREIRTLVDVGIFPAMEQCLLDKNRLAALMRDPAALWQAHRAFASLAADEDMSETVAERNSTTDTRLAETTDTEIVPADETDPDREELS